MLHRLFLSVFLSIALYLASTAQLTINSGNFPVAGLQVGRGYANAPNSVLGTSGGPQFFDFSGITPLYHDSVMYYNASLTPWASFHPGTTVCNVEFINNLFYVYYYTADANTFVKSGLTIIGDFGAGMDTIHGNYLPTDTILSTDYGFNHSETEYSSATIVNLVPFADYKTSTYRNILVDGWGSLQTPLNYYDNVLRIKYVEYRYDTLFYLAAPLYIKADTSYYIKFFAEDVRHPVITSYTDSAFNLQYFEYIFTPPVIMGCTDTMAQNYNPLANQSDGSCIYCNINFAITPDTTICAGNTITLNVSGGSSYLWSDNSSSPALTISPDQTTAYSVYVSTSQDCHALAEVTVTVNEPVATEFWTTHHTYAPGQEVQFVNLSEHANYYQWDFDDPQDGTSTLEFPLHTYNTEGDKYVVLVAGNSCFSDTFTDTISINSSASIETAESLEPFCVFPNPGTDAIFVEGSVEQACTLDIFATDMLGRSSKLATEILGYGSFLIRVDVDFLPAGMYLLELRSERVSTKKKWIKI